VIAVLCSALLSEKHKYYLVEPQQRPVYTRRDIDLLRDYSVKTSDDLANVYAVMDGFVPDIPPDQQSTDEEWDSELCLEGSGGFDMDTFMETVTGMPAPAPSSEVGSLYESQSNFSEYSEARSEFAVETTAGSIGSIIDQTCFRSVEGTMWKDATVFEVSLPCFAPLILSPLSSWQFAW
jgi:hypothetical protein